MTVGDLRNIKGRFDNSISDDYSNMLRNQKFGFTFEEVYGKHSQIIQNIVLTHIIEVNQHLPASEEVRIPKDIDVSTFNSFISKLSASCL